MLRTILCGSALAAMLFVPTLGSRAASAQPQAKQQNEQAKAASGTVTAIGADKKSFSMDVNEQNATHNMQFVIDTNTQVQGRVGVGTKAVVQYQPTNDGKNLAISVAPQNSQ